MTFTFDNSFPGAASFNLIFNGAATSGNAVKSSGFAVPGGFNPLTTYTTGPNDIRVTVTNTIVPNVNGDSLTVQLSTKPVLSNNTIATAILSSNGFFNSIPTGSWTDPPLANGYDYTGTGGTTFTMIMLPPGFSSPFDIFYGPGFGTSLGTFAGGTLVDFTTLTGGALSSFRIAGINPLVDSANNAAFPLAVFFSTATGSFTQTANTVPEPASWMLTAGAVLALCFLRAFQNHELTVRRDSLVGRK